MIFQAATTRGSDAAAADDGGVNAVLLNHQISHSQPYDDSMQNNGTIGESGDDFLQQIMQQYMLQATAGGGLLPDPNDVVNPFYSSPNPADIDASLKALFNGSFSAGSLTETSNQLQPNVAHPQDFGGGGGATSPPTSQATTVAGGNGAGQPRQRVRARRGQATDPHSIAERLRRERIAERMKSLQELVPNANKTDKASMLDEIIDYVKFLQLQVKVLSMSRLGSAAAFAPLVSDRSSPELTTGGGTQAAKTATDGLTVTEQQVAKLMDQDMGSAMQYLQSKGLCLMPISLATAISTATSSPSPSKQPAGT